MRNAASSSRSSRARSSSRRAKVARIQRGHVLANTIQKARDASMPKENIERAIARGSGAGADGSRLTRRSRTSGGPNGVAVLVEAVTDNRNRTSGDLRHVFAKNDGNLGASGSVAWLFERRGVVLVDAGSVDEDLVDARGRGGRGEQHHPRGLELSVVSAPEALPEVRRALNDAGIAYDGGRPHDASKTTVEIADKSAAKKLLRLVDALEENDDVQDVYANFDIPERVLEAVAS